MFPAEGFFTVSQLNESVRGVIQMGFPQPVWVCGEIQGYNRNKEKRHVFFELCEKDPVSKEVRAKTTLVIFAGRKAVLRDILAHSADAFVLKDDIEVKFLCRVDFYPPHGAVRLIVESIDPVYTLGKIAQEKQKLIALLREAGVLDRNKTLPLPTVPLRIGLITAYDSAAYNDFISELKLSGLGFAVMVRNALMQGKSAEADVCQALDELEGRTDIDVIVITRGGGSIADLSCFDSRRIAERIASCRLPVLSGIGHEINITVTDLAAHTHQKTPTAVAQFLVQRVEDYLSAIDETAGQLVERVRQVMERHRSRLRRCALDLQGHTQAFLKGHHRDIIQKGEFLRKMPVRLLAHRGQRFREGVHLLTKTVSQRLRQEKQRVRQWGRTVELADPANTLRRGFSITRTAAGKALQRRAQVKEGDAITTLFADGQLCSTVRGISAHEAAQQGEREK